VDHAVAAECVAQRTAQVARRQALADAPRVLRLSDPLQLKAWDEVWRRVAAPTTTGELALTLRRKLVVLQLCAQVDQRVERLTPILGAQVGTVLGE
jgi:hypothetical protein